MNRIISSLVLSGVMLAFSAASQAQQQAASQASQREQVTGQQLVNFKNAFSVCLEAKEYMVKYQGWMMSAMSEIRD